MLGDKLGKRWKDLKDQFVESSPHAIWYGDMNVLGMFGTRRGNVIYGKYNAMAKKIAGL